MVSLVNKLLYPMDLKRYIVLSFATLWTLALVIALIATIIHQVNFQDSTTEINLIWEVEDLKQDIRDRDQKILELEEKFTRYKEWWYYP